MEHLICGEILLRVAEWKIFSLYLFSSDDV